ncbi:hypothetical protein T06_8842 [Trichinella sp. T6]|nr:hypothetical protein T06_8842 [Trichinella sp. T6]
MALLNIGPEICVASLITGERYKSGSACCHQCVW